LISNLFKTRASLSRPPLPDQSASRPPEPVMAKFK